MEDALIFSGKSFISSKRAAQLMGYTKDYVGQLCRNGKVEARLVGRTWYVNEASIEAHRDSVEEQWRQMGKRTEHSVTQELVPDVVPRTNVAHRADLRPVPLEDFAMTRMPTRRELERKFRQDAMLSSMDVMYEDEQPLYYEDDRPLNPEPYRVMRFEEAPVSVMPKAAYAPQAEPSRPLERSVTSSRVRSNAVRDRVDGIVAGPSRYGQVRIQSRANDITRRTNSNSRSSTHRSHTLSERSVDRTRVYHSAHDATEWRPPRATSYASVGVAVALLCLSLIGAYFILSLPDPGSVTQTAGAGGSGFLSSLAEMF